MPELPEVETIRLMLESRIISKTISAIQILEPSQFIGDEKALIGSTVKELQRRGKVLSIMLSNGAVISTHLKLTGQILYASDRKNATYINTIPYAESSKLPAKSTRVIIEFTDGSALFFNDIRKFGWVKVGSEPHGPTSADVLSRQFTKEYLADITSKTRKPIKTLLMDQEYIAGIGNIYANDSLWAAGINPERKSNSLNEDEIVRLHDSILTTINKGLKYKGSSARDEVYILPDGSKGNYQLHFKVYHREGLPCLKCKTNIIRIKQAGRSSFYCPNCQKSFTHTGSHQSVKDQQLF